MPGDAYAFQGDEEHIIFLTMVAAPGEARIGVLSNDSAHQRFNVAAGPAQDQLWLFHSATLDILSPACMRHRWPIKVRRVSASLAKAYPPDGETGAAKRRQDKESNASLSPSRLDGTASGWRWFRARDAEAHVIHPSSVAVSSEPGAKTDRSTPSCLLARVIGVGIETADMLVHEVLSPRAASRPTSFTQRRWATL